MAYTISQGAPNYWHEANDPNLRKNTPRAGRLRRFSFITRDTAGKLVRRWHHAALACLPAEIVGGLTPGESRHGGVARSLEGMTAV